MTQFRIHFVMAELVVLKCRLDVYGLRGGARFLFISKF